MKSKLIALTVPTLWRMSQRRLTAGVKDAAVNFMAQKMLVEFEDGQNEKAVMKEVLKACKKVEPDCEIDI